MRRMAHGEDVSALLSQLAPTVENFYKRFYGITPAPVLPAETIANPKPGDIYHLTHPLTGKPYTLSVCEVEQKAIDPSHLPDELEYPTHFTAMTFTLSPDLPNEAFSLRDSKEGDAARRKDGKTGSAASVGIIGGAVSPVLMVRQPKDEPRLHSACSALRFEEVPVTWQFCFREKLLEDASLDLFQAFPIREGGPL